MKTKIGRIFATIGATIALQLLMSATASAHTITLQAEAKCVNGEAVVF